MTCDHFEELGQQINSGPWVFLSFQTLIDKNKVFVFNLYTGSEFKI